MALNSPSHRFGQIIGDILEETMKEYLRPVTEQYSLFFDYRHPRNARRRQKEVRWVDINENTHKLDIVMENNGDENRIGEPRVFIEIAWRRYTKHSKNKAQEISGAIRPLIAKYSAHTPFFGAIVAGAFTQNSINQMISEGFEVVYIPLNIIEKSFSVVGIDAHWDESTSEHTLQEKVDIYAKLSNNEVERIKIELLNLTSTQMELFRLKLCNSLERKIDVIKIISLYGSESVFINVQEACKFITNFKEVSYLQKFYKYEIYVHYSNGDKLEAQYADRNNVIIFLQSIGH